MTDAIAERPVEKPEATGVPEAPKQPEAAEQPRKKKGWERRATVLLSVEDVCEALAINQHTFYRYRKVYPNFKTLKVGGRNYMRPETLAKFLRELEAEQA